MKTKSPYDASKGGIPLAKKIEQEKLKEILKNKWKIEKT